MQSGFFICTDARGIVRVVHGPSRHHVSEKLMLLHYYSEEQTLSAPPFVQAMVPHGEQMHAYLQIIAMIRLMGWLSARPGQTLHCLNERRFGNLLSLHHEADAIDWLSVLKFVHDKYDQFSAKFLPPRPKKYTLEKAF